MNGTIKNFLPQKKYGFIQGNDGKDYFFHQSSLVTPDQSSQIADGALVEFDPAVTPKGYKANKVIIASKKDNMNFVVPDTVMLSKSDNFPSGWELLEESRWVITANGRGNPDEVKNTLRGLARLLGANAVTRMNYQTTTGSEGNHNFTIHHFTGRIALVGKRSISGTHTIKDFPDINATAANYKQKCNENYDLAQAKTKKNHRLSNKIFAVSASVSAILALIFSNGGIFLFGLFAAAVLVVVLRLNSYPPSLEGEWLWTN